MLFYYHHTVLTSQSHAAKDMFLNEFPKSYELYLVVPAHISFNFNDALFLLFDQCKYALTLSFVKAFKSANQIPTVLNTPFIVNVSINIAISSIDSSQPPLSHFKSMPICALVM